MIYNILLIVSNIILFIVIRWGTVLCLFLAGMGAGNHAENLNPDFLYVPGLLLQGILLYLYLNKKNSFNLSLYLFLVFLLIVLYLLSKYHVVPPYLIPY